MKAFETVVKILTALAAVAGAIFLLATYGEKIVDWAKKILASCPCKAAPAEEAAPEAAEAEPAAAEEAPAAEEVPAEKPAAEEPAEDPAPEVAAAPSEPVADEADFAE